MKATAAAGQLKPRATKKKAPKPKKTNNAATVSASPGPSFPHKAYSSSANDLPTPVQPPQALPFTPKASVDQTQTAKRGGADNVTGNTGPVSPFSSGSNRPPPLQEKITDHCL